MAWPKADVGRDFKTGTYLDLVLSYGETCREAEARLKSRRDGSLDEARYVGKLLWRKQGGPAGKRSWEKAMVESLEKFTPVLFPGGTRDLGTVKRMSDVLAERKDAGG